jgi:hypothetical protein
MWLPDDTLLPQYEADATALRQKSKCWGEFKWEKVTPTHVDTYKEFLQLTLGLPKLKFTSLVVDTELFAPAEMKKYHAEGGRHVAYLKFMRMLLKQRIRRYVDQGHRDFSLLYDRLAVSREQAGEFHSILTTDMRKFADAKGAECRFEHLSQVNSAMLHLMQATDLLTGATWSAWEKAGGGGKKATPRKAIREQIEEWADGLLTDTRFHSTRYYNLWRWEPAETDDDGS